MLAMANTQLGHFTKHSDKLSQCVTNKRAKSSVDAQDRPRVPTVYSQVLYQFATAPFAVFCRPLTGTDKEMKGGLLLKQGVRLRFFSPLEA